MSLFDQIATGAADAAQSTLSSLTSGLLGSISGGAGSLDAAIAAAQSQIDGAARAIPEVEAETRRLARMN